MIPRQTQFVDNFTKLEGTPSKTIIDGQDGKRIETIRYTLEGSEAKPHTDVPKEEKAIPRVVEVYKGRGTKFVDENGKDLATEVIAKDYEAAREFKGYRLSNPRIMELSVHIFTDEPRNCAKFSSIPKEIKLNLTMSSRM